MSRFKRQGESQECKPELVASLYIIIVTDIVFSQSFHIVHIETHHMSKAVRHEKCMGSGADGIIHIALHKFKVFKRRSNYSAGIQMQFPVCHIRPCTFHGFGISFKYNLVDILLPRAEFTSHGCSAGNVG